MRAVFSLILVVFVALARAETQKYSIEIPIDSTETQFSANTHLPDPEYTNFIFEKETYAFSKLVHRFNIPKLNVPSGSIKAVWLRPSLDLRVGVGAGLSRYWESELRMQFKTTGGQLLSLPIFPDNPSSAGSTYQIRQYRLQLKPGERSGFLYNGRTGLMGKGSSLQLLEGITVFGGNVKSSGNNNYFIEGFVGGESIHCDFTINANSAARSPAYMQYVWGGPNFHLLQWKYPKMEVIYEFVEGYTYVPTKVYPPVEEDRSVFSSPFVHGTYENDDVTNAFPRVPIPMRTEFLGQKRFTMEIDSMTGFRYSLRRSADLNDFTEEVQTKNGVEGPLSFEVDDSASVMNKAFYRIVPIRLPE